MVRAILWFEDRSEEDDDGGGSEITCKNMLVRSGAGRRVIIEAKLMNGFDLVDDEEDETDFCSPCGLMECFPSIWIDVS